MLKIRPENTALVIPTLNAGAYFPRLTAAIQAQSFKPARFLVIDSDSTDETRERFGEIGAQILRIQRSDFDHGGTRQQAIEILDKSEIVIFLTQDAIPATPCTFEAIVAAFDVTSVGAAYGRQLPHPDATAIAAHARFFNYPNIARVTSLKDAKNLGIKTAFSSNSFAAYRREALVDVGGFPINTIASEDQFAVAKMLLRGWENSYVPGACVYHSHNYTIAQEFRRYFDLGVTHARGIWLLESFGQPENEGWKFITSELKYLTCHDPAALPSAMLRAIAKYSAYRCGRSEHLLPLAVKRNLSMHRNFWRLGFPSQVNLPAPEKVASNTKSAKSISE